VSRWEKLAREICASPVPPQASSDDVFRLLEGAGWEFVRYSGRGYAIFKSPDGELLTIPMVQGRHIKRTYLMRICQSLGLDESSGP
jgi:predicted RNA binding protein YcfA (HicA-like mRNA interferase family)